MSNLVEHARRELETIGEEPETIEGYLKVIQAFADMGHSGGSAMVAIPVISELLQFKNLAPLTDDPDEWYYHDASVWGAEGGVWQSKRRSDAFSHDGGKTYYVLEDGAHDGNRQPLHNSQPREIFRKVSERRPEPDQKVLDEVNSQPSPRKDQD